jgi:hypothetical protein
MTNNECRKLALKLTSKTTGFRGNSFSSLQECSVLKIPKIECIDDDITIVSVPKGV